MEALKADITHNSTKRGKSSAAKMSLAREVAIFAGIGEIGLLLCERDEETPKTKPKHMHRYWVKPWIRNNRATWIHNNRAQNNTIMKLYKKFLM